MRTPILAAAALGALVAAAPAAAQTQPQPQAPAASAQASTEKTEWRISKLIGMKVHDRNNRVIGEIEEMYLGPGGMATTVVISAGGFLGMGDRNVAIPFSELVFLESPQAAVAATDTAPQTTRETTPGGTDRVVDTRWDPPVTLGVRLVSVVNDCTQHVGQAAFVRGLLGA